MRQTITHWPRSGQNKYGEDTYGAASTFDGRWEERAELIRTSSNEEVTSKAVVFVPNDLVINEGDQLVLQDFADITNPSLISGASEVIAVAKIPSLRNNTNEVRAFL